MGERVSHHRSYENGSRRFHGRIIALPAVHRRLI